MYIEKKYLSIIVAAVILLITGGIVLSQKSSDDTADNNNPQVTNNNQTETDNILENDLDESELENVEDTDTDTDMTAGQDRDDTTVDTLDTSDAPAADTADWKDTVYALLEDLTDWQVEENVTDWYLADIDRSELDAFGDGTIFRMTKSFNENGFSGSDVDQQIQDASEELTALWYAVDTALYHDGWTLTLEPATTGPYHDQLFVKDGHPLIMQTGRRDAVMGGMYIMVEFLY
jgi:hypothetical protein